MTTRLSAVGGRVVVRSEPGAGTTVEGVIPLPVDGLAAAPAERERLTQDSVAPAPLWPGRGAELEPADDVPVAEPEPVPEAAPAAVRARAGVSPRR